MILAEPPTDEALWRCYETSVKRYVEELGSGADVRHDAHVKGLISCASRQIDVYACGRVAGEEISIAIECKRYAKPVDIMTVDGFVGKVLDIGADRGVLYSYSGFTANAVSRARNARHPGVQAVAFRQDPDIRHNARVSSVVSRPVLLEDLTTEVAADFLRNGIW